MKTDREICDAATPGPWETCEDDGTTWVISSGPLTTYIAKMSHDGEEQQKDNAEFIAHYNPEKICDMLDEIDKLRKDLVLCISRCEERQSIKEISKKYGWEYLWAEK